MATNTAASFTNHTGNGSVGPFSISFSYLSEAEVDVTVGGVLKTITTHYTFTSANQITFTSGNAPGNGVAVKFQRDTAIGSKKVDFVDGSVLTEADLDNNSNQLLFSMQEIVDSGAGAGINSVAGTSPIVSSGGTTPAISITAATTSAAGSMSASDKSKLDGIEASATADQTGAEIKSAYEGESNTNAFTDTEKTKLSGIETSADVTDTTNVDAAGAVMNSDNSTAAMGFVVDEDNMASNSATKVPTQQSVKSYVDANSSDTTYTAGTGLSLSGTTFNVDQIALTTVQTAANESAQLALTTQEGDIVVRSDQNKSYVKNSGTAGTMADFTELLTPTGAVSSVNGNTGAITAAQIATAVEAASDSNTFTDADHSKLNAIEASATADQTDSEIKTAYENNSNTNAFTDAEQTKLNGIATGAEVNVQADFNETDTNSDAFIQNKPTIPTNNNQLTNGAGFTTNQGTVTGVSGTSPITSSGGTTPAIGISAATTSAAGSMSSADKTKLDGVETNATADQTDAEIRAAVEAASDSNVFTDADHTKLNGIEASADVTDATNVDAAGAVMNSDLDGKGELLVGDGSGDPTALAAGTNGYVLKANSSTATGLEWAAVSGGGGLGNVVEDTTPQLGGNLDVQSSEITTSTTNGDIVLNPNGEFGVVKIKGDSTNSIDGTLELACSTDAHGVKIKSPPHSAAQNYTLTLPSSIVNGGFLKTDSNGGLSFATPTDTNTTYSVGDGGLTQNNFTDALKTKLDGITDLSSGGTIDGDLTLTGANYNAVWDKSDNALEFADNAKAIFGGNLEIYHQASGNHSVINETGAGSLIIQAENLELRDTNANLYVSGVHDSYVSLFHHGDRRLITSSTGITVYSGASGSEAATGAITSGDIGVTGDITVSGTVDGRDVAADGTKLDGIESGATADQTAAEIRTLVGNATDSNVFTDADHSKLDGIEASATADQTAAEIKTLVGNATDSNVFTDADHSKLNGIESGATQDQTGAEIKNAYEAESNTNAFTDTEKSKLAGIEASADVTDATNVAGAGALMDGDFTSNGFLKRTGAGSYTVDTNTYLTAVPSGYLQNLSEDTTPQLGGDLDMNSNFISSGILGIKNAGSQSELRLYCESSNAHYASLKAPAHADFSGDITFTIPSGYGSNGQVLQSNGSGGTSWVAQTTAYTNSNVDSHINVSSASSGQILSWNGSDYAWVADQTGGGGGGVTVQDEGSALSTTGTTLNFVGAGVTASGTGATKTITISGGGGGGSGISNLVEDTTPQLGGNLDMQANNISGTGTIIANSTAVATAGMRKIYTSSSAPTGSDGAVGDLWVKY